MSRPFNLLDAMRGKPVETVGGVPVTQLRRFESTEPSLVGVMNGKIYCWSFNGYSPEGPFMSLVMTTKKTIQYLNLFCRPARINLYYPQSSMTFFLTGPFPTEEMAKMDARASMHGNARPRIFVRMLTVETEE